MHHSAQLVLQIHSILVLPVLLVLLLIPAIFVIATLDFIKPMELALHVLINVRDAQLVASVIHVLIQSTESSLKTALV